MVSTSETLYLKSAWVLTERPQPTLTFTQAMADNGELPSVGMEFMCGDEMESDERTVEFKGVKVKVIGISVMGEDTVITFYHDMLGVGCGIFFTSWVKPLTPPKTDKEKAIDDIISSFSEIKGQPEDRASVFIQRIIAGKIHGVTWSAE